MLDVIEVPVPTAILGPLVTGIIGGLVGYFFDRKRADLKCEKCPEHKAQDRRITQLEARQLVVEAKLEQMFERVNEVHDMLFEMSKSCWHGDKTG